MKRLAVWILIASAIGFAAGCGAKRPYASAEAVLTFEDGEWAQAADGSLVLISARWRTEKEMNLEDVRYNYREGAVLTPGFLAAILDRLETKSP